jgi:hypothetical protein
MATIDDDIADSSSPSSLGQRQLKESLEMENAFPRAQTSRASLCFLW